MSNSEQSLVVGEIGAMQSFGFGCWVVGEIGAMQSFGFEFWFWLLSCWGDWCDAEFWFCLQQRRAPSAWIQICQLN